MAELEHRASSLDVAVLREAAAEAALAQILTRVAQDPTQARLAFEAIRTMAGEKILAAVSQASRQQAEDIRGVKASVAGLEKRVVERFENNEKLAEQRHQDAEQRHQDLKDLVVQSIAASNQRHQDAEKLAERRHRDLKNLVVQSIAASNQRHQDAEKLAEQRHQDMQRQNDKLDKWLRVLTTGVISMFLAFLASLIVDRLAPSVGSMAAESVARPAAPDPASGSPGAADPRNGAPEGPGGAAPGTGMRP